MQREGMIGLFSLLLLMGGGMHAQAQKDNRFEISKNLDIFNAVVKEVEMFYVDTVDVERLFAGASTPCWEVSTPIQYIIRSRIWMS